MKVFRLVAFIFIVAFYNCEDILECIINRTPVLPDKQLQNGLRDSYYFDTIFSEVKNDPNDNNYDYYYEVIGDLPLGLEVYYNYRELIFEGYPTERGNFPITINLYVERILDCDNESNDCDGLCGDFTSKDYTIHISIN